MSYIENVKYMIDEALYSMVIQSILLMIYTPYFIHTVRRYYWNMSAPMRFILISFQILLVVKFISESILVAIGMT